MTEAETTVLAAEKSAPARSTDYVILKEDDGGKWAEYATVTATSAKAAVTAYLKAELEDKPGKYVAVPVRSWQPITVEVETQTKLTYS